MTHPPSSTDSQRQVGSHGHAERAVVARRWGRPECPRRTGLSRTGLPRSAAFALLVASSLFAVVGAATTAYAEVGGLVAAVTKSGYNGHPYNWAAPSC